MLIRSTILGRVLAALAAGALALGGCQGDGPTAVGGDETSATWPYWPRAMRVHPLTRVMIQEDSEGVPGAGTGGADGGGSTGGNGGGGDIVIEARIEFSDEFNSTTKAVGTLRLELVEPAGGGARLLEEWNIDLEDPAINNERFDDITRTYLFRLSIEAARFSPTAQLRAYFLSIDGARLTAVTDF